MNGRCEACDVPFPCLRTQVRMDPSSQQAPPNWPRWLTVPTCARYIDRSETATRTLAARGNIPCVKQGDRLYFDRLLVDQWMQISRRADEGKRP
jgi:hypothetical protein